MIKSLGKNIYIWNTEECFRGDVQRIAEELKKANYQSAILHHENLTYWREKIRIALIPALKAVGIRVFAGAAVYGFLPKTEGRMAAEIVEEFDLDGAVFDAESAFDRVINPDSAASHLLNEYRENAPEDALAIWCWWALPRSTDGEIEYHPNEILWAAMDPNYGNADIGMPMMYWTWGNSPAAAILYLETSLLQWRKIVPSKPIEPIGRAYIGNNGIATGPAITAFDQRARELGCQGVSWWSLEHALQTSKLPGVWDALVALPPFGDEQPVEPEPEPEPEPIAFPRQARLIRSFVNVRSSPGVLVSNDIGDLTAGAQPMIFEEKQFGADVWGRIGHNLWVAINVAGIRYLEYAG